MKIIGIGNFGVDYYFQNGKFIGRCGGQTVHNVLANLSSKYECWAIGNYGDDENGQVAIQSLKDLNVNVDYARMVKGNTPAIYINIGKESKGSKINPITGEEVTEFDESNYQFPDAIICDSDVVVMSELNSSILNQLELKNTKIALDIGRKKSTKKFSKEELAAMLNKKFEIIQINEKQVHYMMEKLELTDEEELYKQINANLIVVTYSKNGHKFIYNNEELFYSGKINNNPVDTMGAGDKFLSIIIDYAVKNNFEYNESVFEGISKTAETEISLLVGKIGARALVNVKEE